MRVKHIHHDQMAETRLANNSGQWYRRRAIRGNTCPAANSSRSSLCVCLPRNHLKEVFFYSYSFHTLHAIKLTYYYLYSINFQPQKRFPTECSLKGNFFFLNCLSLFVIWGIIVEKIESEIEKQFLCFLKIRRASWQVVGEFYVQVVCLLLDSFLFLKTFLSKSKKCFQKWKQNWDLEFRFLEKQANNSVTGNNWIEKCHLALNLVVVFWFVLSHFSGQPSEMMIGKIVVVIIIIIESGELESRDTYKREYTYNLEASK